VLASAVGRLHVLVPVVLAVVAWPLVHRRDPVTAGRRVLGAALALVGAAGLAHVGSGQHAGAAVERLRTAGGLASAGLGAPLRSALSPWGAGLVLNYIVFSMGYVMPPANWMS